MQLFACGSCEQLLYFENVSCETCGVRLGFRDDLMRLESLAPVAGGPDLYHPVRNGEETFRLCRNAQDDACNWLVPADAPHDFCTACRLNRTIPDLSDPRNVDLWRRVEAAKHRLVYSLLRLRLPLVSKWDDPERGLAFDFLADPDPGAFIDERSERVMTGHAKGVITINIAEADDAEREKLRSLFAEPYRTLLGHFRHESGHYYWERLIAGAGNLEAFRRNFGDERADYGQAMEKYYTHGAPPDVERAYITAYAASHPWEDWAECWAHYLHMVDTLETAHHFGLVVRPRMAKGAPRGTAADFDPYAEQDFDAILKTWLPVVYAVNSLNRSMGQQELYPFVLSDRVIAKLQFIHTLVHSAGADETAYRPDAVGNPSAAPLAG